MISDGVCMSNEQIELEGVIESVIYQNPENGYTVFSIIPAKTDIETVEGEITCVAYTGSIHAGEDIIVSGSFIMHQSYGLQFNVQTIQRNTPSTLRGIEKYLGSGLIKGIGERLAKRIVDRFKEDTFAVIEDFPEKLSEVRGITLEKALTIGTIFKEQSEQRTAVLFLQSLGVSPVYALKIYNKYKENTITVVKTNPYRLAEDIFGIGFTIADNIAFKAGFEKTSAYRIKCGVQYTLYQATSNGHVFLPEGILIEQAAEMLDVSRELVENCLAEMQMERKLWRERIGDDAAIYLHSFHYAESYTAKRLLEISINFTPSEFNENAKVEAIEKSEGISLGSDQKEAVIQALRSGVLVITGGPGTGKTTTIRTIINILEGDGFTIELAAPTGRAAKRMTETTGKEAKTIHRLLGLNVSTERGNQFYSNDDPPEIEADVVIIDETSMVDIVLMHTLLKAIPPGARLILVGDADQLPSVGPGNVLKDIINSGIINVSKLTEIFRQAQESAIVLNAHKINKGEYPDLDDKTKDFFFLKRNNMDEVLSIIISLVSKRLPDYASCDKLRDIQVLTPMRKSTLGVINMNSVLQRKLNPPHKNKHEKEFRSIIFREGDKVMQIRNNYTISWRIFSKSDINRVEDEGLGIFNGDEGIIDKINDADETIKVVFDDGKVVYYDYTQLDELELSYAITIHKSQGSEYKVVVIPVHSGPQMLLSRNLLYTALTRAKHLAVLVGTPETVFKMVDNNREISRYSALAYRLVKMKDFIICDD